MEHQAALESLLEVYEALRKAVRAQLDGTLSHAAHRGRTDVEARAVREALQVLAAETSSAKQGKRVSELGGGRFGGQTSPQEARTQEARLSKGHVQVFQALWEHILREVVLCLGQADLPEVAGLLECAQEGHSSFLKAVTWPDPVLTTDPDAPTPEAENEERETTLEQIQGLMLENQRLQKTIQELVGWGNPGPLDRPLPPPLVIPPSPVSPGGSLTSGSMATSPAQNVPPRRQDSLAPQMMQSRPRSRTEDLGLLRGVNVVSKKPSPKALLLLAAESRSDDAALTDLLRTQTLGSDVIGKSADGVGAEYRLARSASTVEELTTRSGDEIAGRLRQRLRRGRASRNGTALDQTSVPGAAALRTSAETVLGSFRRMLRTSNSGSQSELPGGEAVDLAKSSVPTRGGGSWFGKERTERSKKDDAGGRPRSSTADSRTVPPVPRTSPRRQTHFSAASLVEKDEKLPVLGRSLTQRSPRDQQRATSIYSGGVVEPEELSPRRRSPVGLSLLSFERGGSNNSLRDPPGPVSPGAQSTVPDGWESFAEISIPSTPRGGDAAWSLAPTPTAAKAAGFSDKGGSGGLPEKRGSGDALPLAEQPVNRSPGADFSGLLLSSNLKQGGETRVDNGGNPSSARDLASGGLDQGLLTGQGFAFTLPVAGLHPPVEITTAGGLNLATGVSSSGIWGLEKVREQDRVDPVVFETGDLEGGVFDLPNVAIAEPPGAGNPEPGEPEAGARGDVGEWADEVPTCSQGILALRDRLLGDHESLQRAGESPPSRQSSERQRKSSSERGNGLDDRENKDPTEGTQMNGQRLSSRSNEKASAKKPGMGVKMLPGQGVAQGGSFLRRLSLKELKILIEEVYASKIKRDARCLACGLPKETLEQHLLSFLTQKFGLRALIAEWLAAALTAVAAFSSEDVQVDIFGKILLNDLDETASLSYFHLRKSLEQAVGDHMRTKHPYAPVDDVAALVNATMRGSVALRDAAALVRALFVSPDSDAVIKKIEERSREAPRQVAPVYKGPDSSGRVLRRRPYSRARSVASKIAISELTEIMLRHHSAVRWRAIQPLVHVFPSYSGGGPALCSDTDLVALLRSFHPGVQEPDIDRVLRWAQAVSGEGPVTFSDCVALLTRAAGELGRGQATSSA